jgi:hypothetical protein
MPKSLTLNTSSIFPSSNFVLVGLYVTLRAMNLFQKEKMKPEKKNYFVSIDIFNQAIRCNTNNKLIYKDLLPPSL